MNTPQKKKLPIWATSFGNQIIASLILGIGLGILALNMGGTPSENPNWLMTTLDTIATTYVSLLRAAVIPLVFTAVVASIANLAQVTNAARLAFQTLIWFAITAFFSVLVGIGLGIITKPGANTGLSTPETYSGTTGSWMAFITSLVPSNFLGLSVGVKESAEGALSASPSFNVLQILVISIAIGVAALKVGEPAQPFINGVKSTLAVIQKVLWWIIRLAPLGTLGLIGRAVYSYGWTSMGALAKFVAVLYLGLAIVFLVLYPLIVKMHGLNVKQYYSGVWPAMQLGFVSRSSMGTMPMTQTVTERNFGVPRGYASFAVPLGATTKMDGCAAVYPALAAIFVAQFYGIDLSISQYFLIVVVSVLGSTATAGTTGAVVMLTLTLSTLGLPLDGVGLLLAIDPIIDMGRTALNVAGQALVPTIVSKREGILNEIAYNAPRDHDGFVDEALTSEQALASQQQSQDTVKVS